MENNEMMNFEDIEVMDLPAEAEGSTGINTGVAIAIGVGIACAIGAGFKLIKKGIAAYKAKKELRKPDREIYVDDEDIAKIVEQ